MRVRNLQPPTFNLQLIATLGAVIAGLTVLIPGIAQPQPLPITFKYVPRPTDDFARVYLPGDFNGWDVSVGAPSEMAFDPELEMWLYVWESANVGQTTEYKIHFHLDEAGSQRLWISDPANPVTNPADNNNSVLVVNDPMIFQMNHRVDVEGRVIGVSAGVFANEEFVEMSFAVNGDTASALEHYDADKRIFRYVLPTPAPPNALFSLTAVDASGDTASSKIGTLPVEVEDAPRPPDIVDGINYDASDPTTVTLSLFAPHKQFVHVIGDFNDWEVSPDFLMKRDSLRDDSVHYWIALEKLTPGIEYGIQYLIDGQIRVGDPYSRKILDPVHDPNLGDVYPNLKRYPFDETNQIVSVFETGQAPYEWKVTDFERPPVGELITYELLVRDFVAEHDYSTLIDTLDYLERLGVNAVELMPVAEFGGNSHWGYEPNFHLAADKYYGPADDLKRFVDACHQRGIAVLLDVVYNHHAYESPFSRMYSSSPTGTPGATPTENNPWLNPLPTHPFNVFNDVNHESTATKSWLDRANAYWLSEFNVDGFRFDLSKGFTQTFSGNDAGLMARYDASRIAILKRMADRLWEVDSTAIVILEHFAEDREQRELAGYGMDRGRPGMLLWQNVNHAYNEATMGYNRGDNSDFSRAYYGPGGAGWELPHLISYMESHDEQWLMYKNRRFGACEASPFGGNRCNEPDAGYNTRDVPIALDRMKMAGAFFLTLPGPHMIWQFGELGYGFGPDGRDCLRPDDTNFGDCPAGTPIRTGEKPIRWEYRQDPLRFKLYKTWSELLRLRSDYETLRSTNTEVKLSLSGNVKRITLHHPEMSVAILGNFGVTADAGSFLDVEPGDWYDFFDGGAAVSIDDPAQEMTLAPGEFHLFTSIPVEPAEEGLITVSSEAGELPPLDGRFMLESFPNPFSSSVAIEIAAASRGPVRLDLFDVLGRNVAVILDETIPAGRRELDFSPDKLPPGTYFLRLSTPEGHKTVPLIRVGSR